MAGGPHMRICAKIFQHIPTYSALRHARMGHSPQRVSQYLLSSVDRASAFLKTVSGRNRLLLLCLLDEGELSVGDLARLSRVRPPAVSQQLALLRAEGLVNTRREGQTIYYSLADKRVELLLGGLRAMFMLPAHGVAAKRDAA